MIEQSALTIIPVFNVGAINADTSAVQGICLLACLRVYVCMGVNWRKRGEEEEVSTQRASENSSTLFLLATTKTCFRVFTNERHERACLCDSVVSKRQFAGSLAWTEGARHICSRALASRWIRPNQV